MLTSGTVYRARALVVSTVPELWGQDTYRLCWWCLGCTYRAKTGMCQWVQTYCIMLVFFGWYIPCLSWEGALAEG
jgi:hypothetical protein